MAVMDIQPRVIRHKDAARYLGVNVNYFNKFIRPQLTEVEYGPQMIAFDRCELDQWFDNYKASNGRSGEAKEVEIKPCRQKNKKSLASSCEKRLGGLIRNSEDKEFAKAVERAITTKH